MSPIYQTFGVGSSLRSIKRNFIAPVIALWIAVIVAFAAGTNPLKDNQWHWMVYEVGKHQTYHWAMDSEPKVITYAASRPRRAMEVRP